MPEEFKLSAVAITSTNSTAVVPATTIATAMIRSITLCNKSTSATASVDVQMFVASQSASYFLFRYTQVTASQTLLPLTTPVVVSAGNELRATRQGEDIDATATYLELS